MQNQEFVNKAKNIKLIIFDIDGVFTDGKIYIDNNGFEIKVFNILDGLGIKLLQKAGINIAIISGRESQAVTHRMKELGIQHVYQKQNNKIEIYENLLKSFDLQYNNIAMMGDDLPDLALLKRVGLSLSVPNAVKEVIDLADYVTQRKGGNGAVREVCEMILKARGEWENILMQY